jgi:hypothetical protein
VRLHWLKRSVVECVFTTITIEYNKAAVFVHQGHQNKLDGLPGSVPSLV